MEKKYNAVNYGEVVDASLIKERSFKRHHFLHKTALTTSPQTGEMVSPSTVRLSLGAEFFDPWNSYLSFVVSATSLSYEGSRLSSSWLNIIRAVTLTDRNGLELERVERVNLLNNVILRAMFGDAYLSTVGATLRDGVETSDLGKIGAGTISDDGSSPHRRVMVPLSFLLGLFRTANLLPPYLMDGAEIRIDWENAPSVLVQRLDTTTSPDKTVVPWSPIGPVTGRNLLAGITYPTYTLHDLEIVTDNYLLDPNLENVLRQEYNGLGLPIKFLTYTQVLQSSGIPLQRTQMVLPIKQSFSRAIKLVAQTRIVPPATINAADGYKVFGKLVYPVFSGQKWIEGTSYYMDMNGTTNPHVPVSEQSVSYWHWLMSFGKNRLYNDSSSPVQEDQMKTQVGTSFCVNFNRNMYSFELSSSALYAESTRVVSGVRIDGTNPATLHVLHDTVLGQDIFGNDLTPAYFPTDIKTDIENNSTREMNGWIEHERYVVCHPQGNRVVV